MIKYISSKAANFIANLSNNQISLDDVDVLRYGIESIINMVITVTIIMGFSIMQNHILVV